MTLSTDRTERDLRVTLDIGDKIGEDLIRDVIGCYVGGYRIIEVISQHMSPLPEEESASDRKQAHRTRNTGRDHQQGSHSGPFELRGAPIGEGLKEDQDGGQINGP